ncbi:G-type lectin S-receptor-like serine/threonine-protein kinase LECRK2 [Glycine soja]|uniref:G-type lectin S-receptor-like serine/threonine-protein kinase LECRK2 n=1 Tax=Glycine soja TaxID=3848 RepID=UPI00054A2D84|nr:G-type lectin S-receptor-like serine/threonine-protein kinase LECRK2 [Glycine soja]KHN47152.1 G-type lectin S-receptor-like serine/threonine-protein kinase RLK1 [Glycine soja]
MDDLLQCTTASQLLKLRIPEQGTGKRVIELGSRLSPEGNQSSWASSSGHFAFGFYSQGDGFAVGIWLVNVSPAENTIVWTANRDSPPLSSNSTLQLTKTGLLFFQDGRQGQVLLSNFVDVTSSASMLDSGNFVLYDDTHNTVVWQSFEHPTDTILGGQNLSINAKLVSSVSNSSHSSGRFFLLMQGDGNLVAYPVNSPETGGDAYWASNTRGSTFQHLSLNVLGFLCLSGPGNLHCFFNHSVSPGMKSQNKTSIYRSTVDVDGNLRLYEHQLEGNGSSHVQVLWSTPLKKCETKGFCGFNSYCSIVTGHAMCECFPGFVPSKSNGNVSLDCVLAHSKGSCKSSEDAMISYKITMLENMSFSDSDDPYWDSQMKKEECEKSFLEDCDCMAVLYLNGNCRKYRLPLTYGRTIQNQVAVALFKVPSGIVDSSTPNNSTLKPRIIVDNKKRLVMVLAITLGCLLLLSLALAGFIFLIYKRKVYKYTKLFKSENLGFTKECSLHPFSFDELEISTRSFTEEIERGSFGAVYRGTIGDTNTSIAVKRLETIADEGEREFRTEITAIARTHHKNLVKLIGFCINGARKLLVYEYVSNGSLASLLFNDEKHMSWRDRLKIALDVARGVLYLHEECEVRIIHCSINPRNILMDEVWTAKISDFGLAKLLKLDHSRMKNEDDETSKYLAPEWQKDAPISVKFDIYSFGMVLLEIVCRRRSIEMNVSSVEEIHLSSWVYQCFAAGQLNKLVKEDEGTVDWRILERMVKVGLWCVQDSPPLRPSIKNVILMLEGLKDIPIPPPPAETSLNKYS